MKDRPILFSAPMVRALLDGSKTQTRRILPTLETLGRTEYPGKRNPKYSRVNWLDTADGIAAAVAECRYGQPGDRLWVRETWAAPHSEDGRPPSAIQVDQMRIHYAASEDRGGLLWRPSIHMPRWASRITLEVVRVRVERLQDISEADAMAEGVNDVWPEEFVRGGLIHRDAYVDLWQSINGPGSWDANPWVWVVEFKVSDQPSKEEHGNNINTSGRESAEGGGSRTQSEGGLRGLGRAPGVQAPG